MFVLHFIYVFTSRKINPGSKYKQNRTMMCIMTMTMMIMIDMRIYFHVSVAHIIMFTRKDLQL